MGELFFTPKIHLTAVEFALSKEYRLSTHSRADVITPEKSNLTISFILLVETMCANLAENLIN